MHCLTIHIGQLVWTMLYRDRANAEAAELLISNTFARNAGEQTPEHGIQITIDDDFGQEAHVMSKSLHGWMLEDLDLSKLAHIEKGIHNAHTQADYAKRAQSDPALRVSSHQGPAIFSPSGNGVFRQ
jgi:hypothetical protein